LSIYASSVQVSAYRTVSADGYVTPVCERMQWAALPLLFGSDRCVAPGGHPARGTASVKIRTIPGPAILSKPRRALFALVSDALPVYHQQTKNILCSYSPQKLGFF
jgi:hypothetical protein